MKNIIEFYYNLSPDNIKEENNIYYFNINNNKYIFKIYNINTNLIEDIVNINKYLSNYINNDKIILNKYNNPITNINNINYILINIKNNNNKLNIKLINTFSMIPITNIKVLERNNWEHLWSTIIDYYETQIEENSKKYPLIRETFDYFIGLAENAISYLAYTKKELSPTIYDQKVLSHNNLYSSLYDPLNIILDHKSRDIAEYIKLSFFNNNQKIFSELDEYFYYNKYSNYGIRVLFARILYPSFYFKIYNDIIQKKVKEKELNKIINNINNYEMYLLKVYNYLRKYTTLPQIEWLKKRDTNSR